MKVFILSCLLLSVWNVQAQEQVAPLRVKVTDEAGKPSPGEQIYFVGQTTQKTLSGITDPTGRFHIDLPTGDVYDIRIRSIGEAIDYNTLAIPVLDEGERFEDMELVITYEAPKNYVLSSLQFEPSKAVIQQSGYGILDDLAEMMQLKAGMKIAIAGHTDSDGDAAANLQLSRQRAEAVKAYLLKKGVAAGRITATGYGESKPVSDNATTAGKQQNRRTEIIVR